MAIWIHLGTLMLSGHMAKKGANVSKGFKDYTTNQVNSVMSAHLRHILSCLGK